MLETVMRTVCFYQPKGTLDVANVLQGFIIYLEQATFLLWLTWVHGRCALSVWTRASSLRLP